MMLSKAINFNAETANNLKLIVHLVSDRCCCVFLKNLKYSGVPVSFLWYSNSLKGTCYFPGLEQELANFSCKGPNSKYFRPCGQMVSVNNYSVLPLWCKCSQNRQHVNKWGGYIYVYLWDSYWVGQTAICSQDHSFLTPI